MADNLRDIYKGSIFDTSNWGRFDFGAWSRKPVTSGTPSGRANLIPPFSVPVQPKATPQSGAFDGKSTFGQNWGTPISNGFNSTRNSWNNPGVTTNAFNGTGVPSGPAIPSARESAPVSTPMINTPLAGSYNSYPMLDNNYPATGLMTSTPLNNADFNTNFIDDINKTGNGLALKNAGFDPINYPVTEGNGGIFGNLVSNLGLDGAWESTKGFLKDMAGTKDTPSWGSPLFSAMNTGISALSALSNYRMAKDSLADTKRFNTANLTNSIKSYNNDVTARAESVGDARGYSSKAERDAAVQAEINKYRMA